VIFARNASKEGTFFSYSRHQLFFSNLISLRRIFMGELVIQGHSLSSYGKDQQAFLLLRKVQQALALMPDSVQGCKVILDALVEQFDAENCSLMLKDSDSHTLSVCVARGKKDRLSAHSLIPLEVGHSLRFEPGRGIAGLVMKEGHAVCLENVRNEPRFLRRNELDSQVTSLVCYPVRDGGDVVGVLNVSHSRSSAFSEVDQLVFLFISHLIEAVLAASQLFHAIYRKSASPSQGSVLPHLSDIPSSSNPNLDKSKGLPVEKRIFFSASDKMKQIQEVVDKVANTDVTVLFQGESGVGKEVVALFLFANSPRRDKPFVKVNCAALPQELIESELFGYEKGAFTGAYQQKPGKFDLAHRGTIFLDEIAEISLPLQAKLLRVLQDKEFSRLGGHSDRKVDVRVLAATNRYLEEAVRKGQFREDLYYRLNVVSIRIPPLRERREEIPILIDHFLNSFSRKYDKKVTPFSSQAMNAFLQHSWPGNVRELENTVHRFVVLGDERAILDGFLSVAGCASLQAINEENLEVWPTLREIQRKALIEAESVVIREALQRSNWERKKAAIILGISYKTLLYKMKNCDISLPL
jgi:two-component system response regulator AtoC